MKKNLLVSLILLLLTNCSDSDTTKNHDVLYRDLVPIAFEELTSDLSFNAQFLDDTLKCEVLTVQIRENDTITGLTSLTENGRLYINIHSSPNEACLDDSCWVAHKILFDVLEVPTTISSVLLNINYVERTPKEINIRY